MRFYLILVVSTIVGVLICPYSGAAEVAKLMGDNRPPRYYFSSLLNPSGRPSLDYVDLMIADYLYFVTHSYRPLLGVLTFRETPVFVFVGLIIAFCYNNYNKLNAAAPKVLSIETVVGEGHIPIASQSPVYASEKRPSSMMSVEDTTDVDNDLNQQSYSKRLTSGASYHEGNNNHNHEHQLYSRGQTSGISSHSSEYASLPDDTGHTTGPTSLRGRDEIITTYSHISGPDGLHGYAAATGVPVVSGALPPGGLPPKSFGVVVWDTITPNPYLFALLLQHITIQLAVAFFPKDDPLYETYVRATFGLAIPGAFFIPYMIAMLFCDHFKLRWSSETVISMGRRYTFLSPISNSALAVFLILTCTSIILRRGIRSLAIPLRASGGFIILLLITFLTATLKLLRDSSLLNGEIHSSMVDFLSILSIGVLTISFIESKKNGVSFFSWFIKTVAPDFRYSVSLTIIFGWKDLSSFFEISAINPVASIAGSTILPFMFYVCTAVSQAV